MTGRAGLLSQFFRPDILQVAGCTARSVFLFVLPADGPHLEGKLRNGEASRRRSHRWDSFAGGSRSGFIQVDAAQRMGRASEL